MSKDKITHLRESYKYRIFYSAPVFI